MIFRAPVQESSKVEARLQFDHAARQAILRAPKVIQVRYIGEIRDRGKVQHVESIEQVSAKIQVRALTDKRRMRQAELLVQTQINIEVAGAAERISAHGSDATIIQIAETGINGRTSSRKAGRENTVDELLL